MFVFANKSDPPIIRSSHLEHCFVRSQLKHPSHSRLCFVLSIDTLQANSPPWTAVERQSTLAAGLLQNPPADDKDDHRTDFAVGYDFANVRDDADEGLPLPSLTQLSSHLPLSSLASLAPSEDVLTTIDQRQYSSRRESHGLHPATICCASCTCHSEATRRALFSLLLALEGIWPAKRSALLGAIVVGGGGASVIKELWRGSVRRASATGIVREFGDPSTEALDATIGPVLLLADLYTHALLTMGDDEFFGTSVHVVAIKCTILSFALSAHPSRPRLRLRPAPLPSTLNPRHARMTSPPVNASRTHPRARESAPRADSAGPSNLVAVQVRQREHPPSRASRQVRQTPAPSSRRNLLQRVRPFIGLIRLAHQLPLRTTRPNVATTTNPYKRAMPHLCRPRTSNVREFASRVCRVRLWEPAWLRFRSASSSLSYARRNVNDGRTRGSAHAQSRGASTATTTLRSWCDTVQLRRAGGPKAA
ncbi:hypothetical protein C8R43DRAFT_1189978 [Mycena crocata]|nr:hypothetical protein C8R43DRAFT_1189978 [Mycena crocata]